MVRPLASEACYEDDLPVLVHHHRPGESLLKRDLAVDEEAGHFLGPESHEDLISFFRVPYRDREVFFA